ncbi:MAG: tyrosine-type recombinase/integrase, partial [Xanthobacteraceae bacterium]
MLAHLDTSSLTIMQQSTGDSCPGCCPRNSRGEFHMRKRLTEKSVAALLNSDRPAAREYCWDEILTGFGICRTPKGSASYMVYGRFGYPNTIKLALGDADPKRGMAFAAAKAKAKAWLSLDGQHKDPRAVEAAERRAVQQQQGHTVASVIDAFTTERVEGVQRPKQIRETKRQLARIRDEFGSRPIHDVEFRELVTFVKARRATKAEARNLLVVVKRLFVWAVHQDYGLATNVARDIKPALVIGKQNVRDRVLSTDEARAVWRATWELPAPFQQAYRLLCICGLRVSECAGARWEEIDLDRGLWDIPAHRMKNGKRFLLPITAKMAGIFHEMKERRMSGGWVFTSTNRGPIALGADKYKKKLNAGLGDMPHWLAHDLRRTISTRLADDLKIPEA